MWTGKRYFPITKFSWADLWLKLLIFFLQPICIYPLAGQGIKRALVLFVRCSADCQFYDHSVSKVRNETFWLDKTAIQCDSYLVPRLSPWLKVFSLVLSLVKCCGINYVRISAHTKIDFWHACTLFILIKKHHYSFFLLHLRCILIQSKSIKFFLAKLFKFILETPVLAITASTLIVWLLRTLLMLSQKLTSF